MQPIREAVDQAAERTGFSGVVRLDRSGETEFAAAYGLADRAHGLPNTVETLFATASGTKGLTALAVMSLVEQGTLGLGTTARSLLGDDLPLGEIYLPTDPPRMFQVIQSTTKPCLAYKVLAAGRRIGSPSEVRRCFEEAFAGIKPTDAVIIGMYQQFGDQVAENAAIVRELGSRQ